jgi:hypothetical protein
MSERDQFSKPVTMASFEDSNLMRGTVQRVVCWSRGHADGFGLISELNAAMR